MQGWRKHKGKIKTERNDRREGLGRLEAGLYLPNYESRAQSPIFHSSLN